MQNVYSKINQYKERIASVLFSGVAIIAAALVATGFKFEWAVLLSWEFYVKTGINYAIMIFIYNTTKRDCIRIAKASQSNELFKAKQRTNRYVKIVRDEHLEDVIDKKADEESERRRINACNRELNKYTYGLELKDNKVYFGYQKMDNGTIHELNEEEFFKSRHLSKNKVKKVKGSIIKALNSQVLYIVVKGYEILTGYQSYDENGNDPQMSIDERHENLKESNVKSFVFLLTAAVTNVIVWNSIDAASFWAMLLAHVTLILSSIISAIASAMQRVDKLIQVETNRAAFLNQSIPFDVLQKYREDGRIKEEQPKKEDNSIKES